MCVRVPAFEGMERWMVIDRRCRGVDHQSQALRRFGGGAGQDSGCRSCCLLLSDRVVLGAL